MTVVFDPRWPKERLARVAKDVSLAWLTLNGIRYPDRVFLDPGEANAWRQATVGRDLILSAWSGVHLSEKGVSAIAVDLANCHRQSRFRQHGNGRWIIQGPGSYEDFSSLGVFCHELGHHVDFTLDSRGHSRRCSRFRSIVEEEEEVSGFEHNVQEAFAEAIRLFVTNPRLLQAGRPLRWSYLTERLRLKPLCATPWMKVLSLSANVVRASAQRWMEDG